MSNLRKTLRKVIADYQQLDDGKFVDTETGEIVDKIPEDKANQSWEQKMDNVMHEKKPRAFDDYYDSKYQNQWGKVSPINIAYLDNMNELTTMDPKSMTDSIISTIEALNKAYGSQDDTYDYVSQDYINKFRLNMSKKKTTMKALEYLTNIYFKGIGYGSSQKRANLNMNENLFTFDLSNKEMLKKVYAGLSVVLRKTAGNSMLEKYLDEVTYNYNVYATFQKNGMEYIVVDEVGPSGQQEEFYILHQDNNGIYNDQGTLLAKINNNAIELIEN